ncbi:ankyrin-1-like [Belonocnema kinseyi]|uniref:ankyrin-1-like n=1 Tax=Belonocnema kinseyi TaxID=2817044 RepID=UPI00143DA5E9|nr:ankyrin-1-like [Belonocnema kinseyi]
MPDSRWKNDSQCLTYRKYDIVTPLFEAAENGDEEKIKHLLDRKVDINTKMKGKTILHVAASNGHEKIVDILCRCRADINQQDYDGLTPLCTAVSKNHVEAVKVLLNYGASTIGSFRMALNLRFKNMALILIKYGTLHDICESRCSDSEFLDEFLNILLSTGNVNVNASVTGSIWLFGFDKCLTPLHLAVGSGKVSIVTKLIDFGADVNRKSEAKMTPLHLAVFNKNVSMTECLLNNGADVNCTTSSGDTSLIFIAKEASIIRNNDPRSHEKFVDFVRITKMLLKKGASVNYHDEFQGFTPLHYAASINEFLPEIVRLLLDYGADVNAVDRKDATPIFYARNEMILEILINSGANVNYVSTSETFFTPLSEKIINSSLGCVEVLLKNGADINIRNSDGKTVVETRSHWTYKNIEILETIINHMSDINSAILHLGCLSYYYPKLIRNLAAMIVKRKVTQEINIDLEFFDSYDSDNRYEYICTIIPMCEVEIYRMKKRKVNIHNLNFFDILDMPINRLLNYVEREQIRKLESDNIEKEFPLYAQMLQWHIKQAKTRRSLIDSSAEAFKKLIFQIRKIKLPDLIVYEIVPLLGNEHLTLLAKV